MEEEWFNWYTVDESVDGFGRQRHGLDGFQSQFFKRILKIILRLWPDDDQKIIMSEKVYGGFAIMDDVVKH